MIFPFNVMFWFGLLMRPSAWSGPCFAVPSGPKPVAVPWGEIGATPVAAPDWITVQPVAHRSSA